MNIFTKKQQEIAVKIDKNAQKIDWLNWKWQLKHSVRTLEQVENLLNIKFEAEYKKKLEETLTKFPLSITPYYLSLIKTKEFLTDPVYLQSVPLPDELIVTPEDLSDPLSEDTDSPVPGLTHRYPDRVLLHLSNVCSMYCRHCTRKRKVGDTDADFSRDDVIDAIEYIRNTPAVRDVLLSGGDPFLLPDEYIDWVLSELRRIPHVEVIRIGTRTPVVMPYRITDDLVDIIKKYHPVWVNTHFNHPREVTDSSREALRKLADAGIPLGNQTVLLAGINDCPRIMKRLMHKMVINRVRPYYIYQCDLSEGLSHFRTPVGKGIEIIESLIGHTSGYAVPTYVIDAPGGGGKIPVMPNYLISWSTNKVVLRNYEGVISTYKEPDSYSQFFCDRNCNDCALDLNLEPDSDIHDTGISELLADDNDRITLIPFDNDRFTRRQAAGSQDDESVGLGEEIEDESN